jgi:hypothetical protein
VRGLRPPSVAESPAVHATGEVALSDREAVEALKRLVELQEQLVRLSQERIEQLEREQEVLAELRAELARLGSKKDS